MRGSASVVALSLLLGVAAFPAWADGGDGGKESAGAGTPIHKGGQGYSGADGESAVDDAVDTGGGGGGSAGGGDGGNGSYSASSWAWGGAGGTALAKDGSAGADNADLYGGGGGGGGFNGADVGDLDNSGALQGGNGGRGGNGDSAGGGGGGGGGGYGAVVTNPGSNRNTSSINGGNGGKGGAGGATFLGSPSTPGTNTYDANGGGGGAGGVGILFTSPGAILVNSGTITGGNGGAGGIGYNAGSTGANGAGGVGIVGSGLSIVNSGLVRGGLSGDGISQADAISLSGSDNRLELWSLSTISGNVVVSGAGANNVLALGGSVVGPSPGFDVSQIGPAAQYRGFDAFEKTGTGTWTLTGTTAAVTPWMIKQGTLSVTSDASLGNVSGALIFDGGTLQTSTPGGVPNFVSNRAVTLLAAGGTIETTRLTFFDGDIVGAGGLTKTGILPLVLGGTNTYLGPTIVNEGTLSPGSAAGFSESSAFTVAAGASIELRGLDASIGSLAGDGSVTNSNVAAAALTIGADNTSKTFNGTLSNTSGALSLTKVGNGTQTLNGINTFTGPTTVSGGKLVVGDSGHAGASLAGSVAIAASGTLGGAGTVGGVTVVSGGTLAPGNSIGTLHVAGDVAFAAGSTYEVEVDAAGRADKTAATGTATINGGTVKVLAGSGNYAPQTDYTILTADSGRTGTFAEVTSNLAFLDPSLGYDANNVYLTMTRNTTGFQNVGRTPNQIAAGGGVEALGSGNQVYGAVLSLSTDQARAAFDALSGEVHASARTALIEDSRFLRDAANERMRAAFAGVGATATPVLAYGETGTDNAATAAIGHALVPADTSSLAAWGSVFGSWGSTDSDGNAAGFDRSTGGFLTGIDGLVTETLRLGVMTGYSRSSFDVDGRASSGSSDNYHLGAYGGAQMGRFGLRAGVGYTWHDVSTSRTVTFPGFAENLNAGYDAGTFQAFGEAGYRIDTPSASFEPFANLAYVRLHTDGFTEKGGAAALTGSGQSTDTTFTTLGVRASTTLDLGQMKAAARGMIGWRHAFGDKTPFATQGFTGGNPFAIAGVPIARDAAVIEAGLDFDISDNARLGISYAGQFGSKARDNGVKADFTFRF